VICFMLWLFISGGIHGFGASQNISECNGREEDPPNCMCNYLIWMTMMTTAVTAAITMTLGSVIVMSKYATVFKINLISMTASSDLPCYRNPLY
jgi:hypothetical protein